MKFIYEKGDRFINPTKERRTVEQIVEYGDHQLIIGNDGCHYDGRHLRPAFNGLVLWDTRQIHGVLVVPTAVQLQANSELGELASFYNQCITDDVPVEYYGDFKSVVAWMHAKNGVENPTKEPA